MKNIIIAITVCSIFVLVGCEDVHPEKVSNSQSLSSTDTSQAKSETYKIGDSVKAGNLIFTVNSTRIDKGNEIIKPKDGNIYYIVDVTIENSGNKSKIVSSIMMFKLSDSDGYNYTVTFGPETKGQLDGEISAGKKMRGELIFEIPEQTKGHELVIDPTLGSGQIIVKLDK